MLNKNIESSDGTPSCCCSPRHGKPTFVGIYRLPRSVSVRWQCALIVKE
jgi:hypothetical protein